MLRTRTWSALFAIVLLATTPACDDDTQAGRVSDEGETCDLVGTCVDGAVCMAVGDAPPLCTLTCETSADACGSSATCAGVGSLSLDVCQPSESVAGADGGPSEEERTSLPCLDDASCEVLVPGAVCGTWRGHRECTLPCSSPDTCNPPTFAGMTTSFMTCDPDEDADRNICVPDEACFADPFACVEFAGMPPM